MCLYPDLRIDIQNPLPHDLCLIPPDTAVQCDNLTVQIGQADLIPVNQIQGAHAAPRQRLRHVPAYAADAEDRHPGTF